MNEGIPGNRVLQNGKGPAAVSRFEHDVLSQTNVKFVVISEGINDIGIAYGTNSQPNVEKPTAQELEAAYTRMAELAHAKGVKVIGATITPFGSAAYYSKIGDSIREAVNAWMRTTALSSKIYDSVVDFDTLVRSPGTRSPEKLNAPYDSGNGLHPNAAGYRATSEGIYKVILAALPKHE